MTTQQSPRDRRHTTHDQPGVAARDVLNEARLGDAIHLQLEFDDHPFVTGHGTVVNVIEEPDDDSQLVRKTFQIETTGDIELVNIGLQTNTDADTVDLRPTVRLVKQSEDDYVVATLDSLVTCELNPEREETA